MVLRRKDLLYRITGRVARRNIDDQGFTLTELLLAIAIVAILLILLLLGLRLQIARGYDARKKTDLDKIRRAFEEYYNDNDCYPSSDILQNCGGPELRPYLAEILCDPVSKEPYLYVPLAGNQCGGYAACTALGDLGDIDIEKLGCNPSTGCGWGAGYNYCIAEGVSIPAPGFDPGITPTATPTGGGSGTYACSPSGGGTCNLYADPGGSGCPVTYGTSNCNNQCGNSANWCDF